MENLSTNAQYRGGVMHSSDEGAVMALERRHELIQLESEDNWQNRMTLAEK